MFVLPPAARKYLAAAKIASAGLYGSFQPSPLASTPYCAHSDGRNCIQPSAPALETLRSRP